MGPVAMDPGAPTRTRSAAFFRVRIALAVLVLLGLTAVTLIARPDMALVAGESLLVQAHLGFAIAAFALGAIQLAGRKGGAIHRVVGWTWVTMIATVIVSSFFIMNDGHWSWIHATSVVHGATLGLAVWFAIRRNIRWHARMMTFTYVSGLIGALLLAFIPGRLMWSVFFGHPA